MTQHRKSTPTNLIGRAQKPAEWHQRGGLRKPPRGKCAPPS
jgi:hypothetical protein